METAEVKFNGGNLAWLCKSCDVIMKTGEEFTIREKRLYKEGKLPAKDPTGTPWSFAEMENGLKATHVRVEWISGVNDLPKAPNNFAMVYLCGVPCKGE